MEKNLNYDKIKDIMDGFAKKGIIFPNESQLQHELAWAIKQMGYNVHLEVLSSNKEIEDFVKLTNKSEREKYYTDIIVDLNKNECIAIELKYKVLQKTIIYETNGDKYITFSQGAPDLGSYLFWKDVERLENFNNNNKLRLNFNNNKKVIKSFSIMLSNDKSYWEGTDNSLYKEFYPKDNQLFSNDLCCWIKFDKENCKRVSGKTSLKKNPSIILIPATKDNYQQYTKIWSLRDVQKCEKEKSVVPISLKGHYTVKWNPYNININNSYIFKNGQKKDIKCNFKYIILEIK